MKDEQTNTYTDTFTPTPIIESQWGADEAQEILGWEEDSDDSDDDSDDDD